MSKRLTEFSKSLLDDALLSLQHHLANNQFMTRQVFNNFYSNDFDPWRDKQIKVLLSMNYIGKLKRHDDKRCVFYFITYRGRKYLADTGVKSQTKYLNLQ